MKQKIAILDSNYRDQQYSGLAASWLRWELQKRGISEVAANIADYIFITVASQQGVKSVKRELRKNKNAKIIMGGCGCYAPAIFDDMADIICVGEGKNFIDVFLENGYEAVKSLPETWIPGDTKIVIPNPDFPFARSMKEKAKLV